MEHAGGFMENYQFSWGDDVPNMNENTFMNDSDKINGDNLLLTNHNILTVMLNTVQNFSVLENTSFREKSNDSSFKQGVRDPLSVILPITICYIFIFIAGVLGNVITCIVIANNKTMHTATNYYLFNLAVSDFLVLIFGMPPDLYNVWFPSSYPFSQTVCILQGLLSETSTNATVLTITSFTVERYIAICHPFKSHTMSKLSRVVKFIFTIWIIAFLLAAPQAFQFGIQENGPSRHCTVKNPFFDYAFEISSFLFFFVPMTLICVLYILIGIKLRKSKLLYGKKRKSCDNKCISGQTRVIRMLIAVVLTFFCCWFPFHGQRIMAIYGRIMHMSEKNRIFLNVYSALTYISGILYFLSTCINPLLYNIMSHKFRNASKLTLFVHCVYNSKKTMTPTNYSTLSLKYAHGRSGRQGSRNGQHTAGYDDIEIRNLANNEESGQVGMANTATRSNFHSYVVVDGGMGSSSGSHKTSTTSLSRNNSSSSTRFSSSSSFKKSSIRSKKSFKKTPVIYTPPVLTPTKTSSSITMRFFKFFSFKQKNNEIQENSKETDVKRTTLKSNQEDNSTNTISNSSLREVDEEELNSTELAEFLAEMRREMN